MMHCLLSDLRPLASGLTAAPLLFAAFLDDLLKVVVPFVFLIFWVLSQISEAKKKTKAARQAPPPPSAGEGNGAQARAAADPLREQVDAFLRRAGDQGPAAPIAGGAAAPAMQKGGRPATPNRDSIEILLGDESVSVSRPPLSESLSASQATRSEPAAPVSAPSRPPRPPRSPQRVKSPRPKSVADHVAENVTSAVDQIRDEVSHLGDRVTAADRQFSMQLQQKFDHEIGTLGDRHAERVQDQKPAVAVVNPAVQIASLLASPDGMRQAMLINEILRRPEERW